MSIDRQFQVNGMRELQKAMRMLGPNFERKVSRQAARAGAVVIAKEAKDRVPVESGTLKRAINVKSLRNRPRLPAYAIVRVLAGKKYQAKGRRKNKDGFYAHIIERGSKFHRARPFLRPALDTAAGDAIRRTGQYISERIRKLVPGNTPLKVKR